MYFIRIFTSKITLHITLYYFILYSRVNGVCSVSGWLRVAGVRCGGGIPSAAVLFPSPPAIFVFRSCPSRGLLSFRGLAVFSAPSGEMCVSGPRGSVFFRPSSGFRDPSGNPVLGARPPCCPYAVGRPDHGMTRVWCGLCALRFRFLVCGLCALVWWRVMPRPDVRRLFAAVRWPRSLLGLTYSGGVRLLRGVPFAAEKMPKIRPVVAVSVALGVPFSGRGAVA